MSKLSRKLKRIEKKNGISIEKYYNGNVGKIKDVYEINNTLARVFTTTVFIDKRLPKEIETIIKEDLKDIITTPDFIPLMKNLYSCHSHIDNYLTDITVYELNGKYNVKLTFKYKPNTNWMDVLKLFTKDSLALTDIITLNYMATVWQNMGINGEDIKDLLDNYKLSAYHTNILQKILNTPEYMSNVKTAV